MIEMRIVSVAAAALLPVVLGRDLGPQAGC